MAYFTLPPSGNSTPLRNILYRPGSAKNLAGGFRTAFAERQGLAPRHIIHTASGATALYLALLALKSLDSRRQRVAVPAWCCPSVPQAVLQAGLEPVLVDLDPSTLEYDAAALRAERGPNLLAVVLVHFFGMAQPIPSGDWSGTAILRDCAQDFDHRPLDGIPCFYSFGRGKALNAGHGGALCVPTEGPFLEAVHQAAKSLPTSSADPRPMALAINFLSKPRLYWAVTHLPGLSLGKTEWHAIVPELPAKGFDAVALASLEAYEACRGFYGRLAGAYRALLSACDGDWVASPAAAPGSGLLGLPTRFPILVRDLALRDSLLREVGARFGGVTRMYPSILTELPGAPTSLVRPAGHGAMGEFPGARRVARELLAFPITAEMRGREVSFLACVAEALDKAGALRKVMSS